MALTNPLIKVDSYKDSHFKQYPPGTKYISSYVESRGGQWDKTTFFGLQMFIKDVLLHKITQEEIEYAAEFNADHGIPFNKRGWSQVVTHHNGYMPLRVQAVPEGSRVDISNVLTQVVNTDPDFYWGTSFIETAMLRAIWYPTTVASLSYEAKKSIFAGLVKSADDPESEILFKLHDFGARGVSSGESAQIGGLAHLVNFRGTDTKEAIWAGREYYDEKMAGFSIPAMEHSTVTSWGSSHESRAYENMIEKFAVPGSLIAIVSDSYDIYNAATNIFGTDLNKKIIETGATVVIRPDSGDPTLVPVEVIELLMDRVGYTLNSKGYKVLPSHFRVIQGDGMNIHSINKLIQNLLDAGISLTNIAFGMGGGLLQQVNRDTQQFAMKQSAIAKVDDIDSEVWSDVYKNPIGDSGKRSKRGRLALIKENGRWETVRENSLKSASELRKNMLRDVYIKDSSVEYPFTRFQTLAEIRAISDEAFDMSAQKDEIYA